MTKAKSSKPIQGFDAVAKALSDFFQGVLGDKVKKKMATTARGTASNAAKLSVSNFQQSAQGRNHPTDGALDSSPSLVAKGLSFSHPPTPHQNIVTASVTPSRTTCLTTNSTPQSKTPIPLPTPTHLYMGQECYDNDVL